MTKPSKTGYAMKRDLELPIDAADKRVREALAEEGFGVLTEIDVAAVFDKKLGKTFRPYRILGACNPTLAHQAISAETDIGLLLPCNVIVYEGESPSTSVVAAIDPVIQLGVAERDDMGAVAQEVRSRLERVLAAL